MVGLRLGRGRSLHDRDGPVGASIALPRIAEHFEADLPTVQWIVLSYILATSALVMPMGRLADMIGQKRVLMAGLVVFMVAAADGSETARAPASPDRIER